MKKAAKKRSGSSKLIRPSYSRPSTNRAKSHLKLAPVQESNRVHDLTDVVEAEAVMDVGVEQEAEQIEDTLQDDDECILIRNSEDISVHTTSTQAAVSLEAALQLAIAVILSITIGDSPTNTTVSQELMQRVRTRQQNHQKLVIDNSSCIRVTTTDTDISVNIQALLQVLLALVAKIDIL